MSPIVKKRPSTPVAAAIEPETRSPAALNFPAAQVAKKATPTMRGKTGHSSDRADHSRIPKLNRKKKLPIASPTVAGQTVPGALLTRVKKEIRRASPKRNGNIGHIAPMPGMSKLRRSRRNHAPTRMNTLPQKSALACRVFAHERPLLVIVKISFRPGTCLLVTYVDAPS